VRAGKERFRPRCAQKFEGYARLAQHLGEPLVFQRDGRKTAVAVFAIRARAIHHALHERDRALLRHEVHHDHEARISSERGAEGFGKCDHHSQFDAGRLDRQ
jgi:hypothetical protein